MQPLTLHFENLQTGIKHSWPIALFIDLGKSVLDLN